MGGQSLFAGAERRRLVVGLVAVAQRAIYCEAAYGHTRLRLYVQAVTLALPVLAWDLGCSTLRA